MIITHGVDTAGVDLDACTAEIEITGVEVLEGRVHGLRGARLGDEAGDTRRLTTAKQLGKIDPAFEERAFSELIGCAGLRLVRPR